MKITVNVDCTPEEARTFLGLPDFKPLHDVVVSQLQHRLSTMIPSLEPEHLLAGWLAPTIPGLEPLTKALRAQLELALGRGGESKS